MELESVLRFVALLAAVVVCAYAAALFVHASSSEASPDKASRRAWFRPADVGMWIIAVAALCAAAASRAQETSPNAPIDCVPAYGPFASMSAGQAAGQGVVAKSNAWGDALAWWCPNADRTGWIRNSWVLMHSTRFNMTNLSPSLKAVLTHASPLAAAQRMALQYAVIPSGAEKLQYELLHAQARKLLDPTRPADPAWVTDEPPRDVKSRNLGRLAYPIKIDGTPDQGRPVPLRARPGRTCSCSAFAIRNDAPNTLWCSWQDAPPHVVTLCRPNE